MSGVAIVMGLLKANAALVATVPIASMYSGVIPQGTAGPCIGVTTVSSTDRQTVRKQSVVKVTERVQVTLIASTYPLQKTTMKLIRAALRDKVGNAGSYFGTTCRLDGQGPDFNDPQAGFCMQTQDALVTFDE